MKQLLILSIICTSSLLAADGWQQWMEENSASETPPVVQNRQIERANHLQIVGPLGGWSERQDLYNNKFISVGLRYHFSETHAWEIGRLLFNFPTASGVTSSIRDQTGFVPDAQTSKLSANTSYIFTPIYGKYAWFNDSLIYFDIYALAGGGVRWAQRENQPFAEFGIGMNHYITSIGGIRMAVTPELRWRAYQETRTDTVFVSQLFLQLGVSWLL